MGSRSARSSRPRLVWWREQIPWGKTRSPFGPWNLLPNRSGDLSLVTGSPKSPFFLKLRANGRSVSKCLRYHGGLKLDLFKAFSLWRYGNCSPSDRKSYCSKGASVIKRKHISACPLGKGIVSNQQGSSPAGREAFVRRRTGQGKLERAVLSRGGCNSNPFSSYFPLQGTGFP